MDEFDEDDDATSGDDASTRRRRRRSEGVRIIGAEEAARALQEGQAAGRRPDDAPRFGDVPERPEAPPAAARFPLPARGDATRRLRRPQPAAAPEPPPAASAPSMPHWTEPPSGEVPRVLMPDDAPDDDLDAWASLPSRGPRWRDGETDWGDADYDDMAELGDDAARVGALDEARSEQSDLFSFDDAEPVPEEPAPAALTTSIRTRMPPPPAEGGVARATGRRDVPLAAGVGATIGLVALLVFKAGPVPALLLATGVVTLAAAELYHVITRAGYRPATLLGLTATVALMIATYNEAEAGIVLVVALTTLFAFLWYLFEVVRARPTINVAVTLLGVCWIGLFGSFAALLLSLPRREGIAFLLGAIIATVAYDVGGWFFGSQMGSRALLPAISPNKTVEGLVGGMAAAVFASVLLVGVVPGISPWTPGKALALGLVVAVVAPIGDLCESMVKRDLGVKDMGSVIPGHGGVLDRFDALLFVMPATYYLVKLLDLA